MKTINTTFATRSRRWKSHLTFAIIALAVAATAGAQPYQVTAGRADAGPVRPPVHQTHAASGGSTPTSYPAPYDPTHEDIFSVYTREVNEAKTAEALIIPSSIAMSIDKTADVLAPRMTPDEEYVTNGLRIVLPLPSALATSDTANLSLQDSNRPRIILAAKGAGQLAAAVCILAAACTGEVASVGIGTIPVVLAIQGVAATAVTGVTNLIAAASDQPEAGVKTESALSAVSNLGGQITTLITGSEKTGSEGASISEGLSTAADFRSILTGSAAGTLVNAVAAAQSLLEGSKAASELLYPQPEASKTDHPSAEPEATETSPPN